MNQLRVITFFFSEGIKKNTHDYGTGSKQKVSEDGYKSESHFNSSDGLRKLNIIMARTTTVKLTKLWKDRDVTRRIRSLIFAIATQNLTAKKGLFIEQMPPS